MTTITEKVRSYSIRAIGYEKMMHPSSEGWVIKREYRNLIGQYVIVFKKTIQNG